MQNELENKILDWLEKQGYPLEMTVARAFQEIDAGVSQSSYYIDPETEKPREIDVVARWTETEKIENNSIKLRLSLFIECKSQQKGPWIIFSNGMKEKKNFLSMSLPATFTGHNLLVPSNFYPYDSSPRMNSMQGSPGYGITQAFESKADIPYQALMSSVKAAITEIRNADRLHQEFSPSGVPPVYIEAAIAIPIIVTDAPLFECYLSEDNFPALNRITSYCLEWKYPLATEFYVSYVYAYIYEARALKQLLTDIKELKDELFMRLNPLLATSIEARRNSQ